ncbi:MAG: universal stress protein [Nitrospirae bacterium]|nr:universal stress protein [Nitrospirota bacterium]
MKILLATDGSEHSEGAAKFLTGFKLTPNDEIFILHAVSWVPLISEWESLYIDFRGIMDEVAPRILESTANILKSVNVKIDTSFVEDFPDKAIVNAVVQSDLDLIVMGARGLKGIGSYIVGSVTRLVAINSPKPVLIVKPAQWKKSGKLKILFATDGSAHSEALGEVLSSIPFPDDTEVTVLNVVFPVLTDIPERFALEINDRIKEMVAGTREAELRDSEKITEKARQYLSKRFPAITEIARFGDPSEEILKAAETLNTDIIAVGSSGMRGIRGMLGSVSRYIMNHAGCSVLIGKK